MMYDFEDVNAILADLADKNIVEPMAEPIDESDCHPMDWAEVVGIADDMFDEIYPEAEMREMVDENGEAWYVQGI